MSAQIIGVSHETIGASLLLYPMLRQLRVAEIIDLHCPSCSEISVGVVVESIILSRLSQERVPMYKMADFCAHNGVGTMYSIDSVKMNDDRTGRALDAMNSSLEAIKASIIVGVIKEFDLTVSEIHTDRREGLALSPTNILFSGCYEKIEDGQLRVTYGHTKKGQDCRKKQVNLSLSITDESIPVWYDALDGNTGDNTCYVPHLEALENELGITSPLVVGDSKLVSKNNMIAFCRASSYFIGPASVDKKEKERLLKLWENGAYFVPLPIKEISDGKILFWGMETERKLTDKERKRLYLIRYLYIFSHQRREVIRHTRAKNFKKAKSALHKIIRCLNKYDYKTDDVINSRIKSYVTSKCPYYKVKLTKDRDGLFSITYSIDWKQLRYDEMFDGIYVLKSNCKKEEYPIIQVLGAYKGQCKVECSFASIKGTPISVEPVWLHKPERIESLLFIVFVGLLLMALLEREARQKIQPKRIPLRVEGRDKLPLTASVLLDSFSNLAIYTITQKVNGKIVITKQCSDLSDSQRYILWVLSFPTLNSFIR